MSTRVKILLGVLGLFGLCVITGVLVPSEWRVRRSVVIKAPPERIHPYVEDFHRWREWAKQEKPDPSQKYTYAGAEKGVGAEQRWTGDRTRGHMRIVESDPATGVRYETAFLSDDINGEATMTYAVEGDGTRVTWEGYGRLMPVLGLILAPRVEAGVNDYYAHALGLLRDVVEKGEAAEVAPQAQPEAPADGGVADAAAP